MPYAVAHIDGGVVSNVSVWDELPSDPTMVDITSQPQVSIGWSYSAGVFTPPPADPAALKDRAQERLDHITGPRGTVLRCIVAGVPLPIEWKSYIVSLRNIVNGTDTTSTGLPAAPAYPAGT